MQIAVRDANGIPRSRGSDPDTSKQAELFMRRSGKLNEQQSEVLKSVKTYPGHTAREYEELLMMDGIFHRRLVELERKRIVRRGESRRCRIGGLNSATWWPIP